MAQFKQEVAPTGVVGLDDVLRGGFPGNRLYLVKGEPGTGKTTLALQFLLEGAAHGEVGLYITLSETSEELRGVSESHGWSLEALHVYELQPRENESQGQYTMFQPSEVELSEVMETLLEEVKRLKPTRVVFDSLSEIRLLAQHPLRYRRQILALKQHFAGTQCTVLLLDDDSADKDNHLESLAHGVVKLERHAPIYGGARRRLEVEKLRGVQFRDGYHDFSIERGGLVVYPRLISQEYQSKFRRSALGSGVAELDELLGGGLDAGTATLIMGPAGCGKSSLGAQYALASASKKERAVIYSFDESIATLLARSDGLGMPMREKVDADLIRIVPIDPAEMTPGRFSHEVRRAVEQDQARVIVIDSLTGYLNAMPEERFLVNQLHELLSFLSRYGVITLLVSTQHGLIGDTITSPVDVSYLADGVVLLRYFEAGGSVRNSISVLKKRSGMHERTIREFQLDKRGIRIGSPLHEFHGVLTGVPAYAGHQGPLMHGGP